MQPALDLCDTFEINKLNMEMLLQKQPPEVFCKKVFLDISQISQENTCARISFLIKLQASEHLRFTEQLPWLLLMFISIRLGIQDE